MATNDRVKVAVAKKMDETEIWVESMTNRSNQERQIQINETYFPKDSDELAYGRRGININIIDVPAVIEAISEIYEEETGKKLETE